jgi:hypothetical protein
MLGDGTPQALIPIFTGKTELELPRTLKRLAKKDFVDVYPMVWKDFRKKGYVTAKNVMLHDIPPCFFFIPVSI